jgi:hypothetical protein
VDDSQGGVVGSCWRVPVRVPAGKLIIAAAFVLLAVLAAAAPWQAAVALMAAAGVSGWAVRDLAVPVRLAAGPDGLTLTTGIVRRTALPWSEVERVRVDTRRRSRLLEIDVGRTLDLFSRYDLDEDLDGVAARLERLRTAAR